MDKFFPWLMRALAAAAAVAGPYFVGSLIMSFGGPAPSDISGTMWMVISGVVIFLLNLALSLFRKAPV